MSEKHEKLVDDVKKYSLDLFGDQIIWKEKLQLPGAIHPITPDLVGTDNEGSVNIVDVKTEFTHADSTPRRDASYKSIGQLLNYAFAYMEKYKPHVKIEDTFNHVRLFVVGAPLSAPIVQDICEHLQLLGINIT